MVERKCSVQGCDRKHAALGFCKMHYKRHKFGRDLEAPVRRTERRTGCLIEGCEGKHRAWGYCTPHAREYYTNTSKRTCEYAGCDRLTGGYRICSMHYQREKAGIFDEENLAFRVRPGPNARGEHLCTQCLQWLPSEKFQANSTYKWGLINECKVCHRFSNAARLYGVTVQHLKELLDEQDGRCSICRSPFFSTEWHVDHDHGCCPEKKKACGECVRGLLCSSCNCALGFMHDSVENLNSAIEYLNLWEQRVGSNT